MARSSALKGKKVVLTGKFRHSTRKEAEAELKKLGATPSGSVGPKTDLLFAGAASGSKLYDAYRLRVPILSEEHLRRILGGAPLAETIELARTFYTLERTGSPAADTHNRFGGLPPGIGAERWPVHGGVPMKHLFTLDLASMPALQVQYPEYRTLSVFCSSAQEVSMYEIAQPKNALTALRFVTQAQVDENPEPPAAVARSDGQGFSPVAHPWSELGEFFGRSRVLGAVPSWCQSEQHQGNFVMQGGEELGIWGDGLVYVFDDAVFAQFT